MQTIRNFLIDESGATAVELALIAMGLALAIIASVHGLSTRIGNAN
jgi:pilus assembly protein Flp/PilA